MRRIVDLELAKVASRPGLLHRDLRLRADSAARDWLAEHGFDAKMGARPLKRLIEERVVAPLAVRLSAEGQLRDKDVVIVVGEVGRQALDIHERDLAIVL